MKIIITGSESFIGKEIIRQCKDSKIEIIGIDVIEKENSEFEYHKMNITEKTISNIIPNNVDAIIHLAALSRDPDCKGKAFECFQNNVMGTLNLMNCAKEKNVKQFIFASSEWVYDEFKENESKNEKSPINSLTLTSEYALSKLTSEINLKQEYQSKFCDVTILRFGIIYGPRKNNWSAVESICNQIKNKTEIQVGSLKNGRRFIHVTDIVKGIMKSIGLKGCNTINLTGDKIITIADLIEVGEKFYNKKIKVTEKDSNEKNIRNPSNNKAKDVLNWTPEISLEEGLKSIDRFL
jgi:nucleoside-diphosphate-sugar epimerase